MTVSRMLPASSPGLLGRVFGALKVPGARIGYDRAKSLIADEDSDARRKVAAAPGMAPEILYYLAGDPEPAVRREVAQNRAAPAQADLLLARDSDERVRCDLAHKVGRLAPGLSAEERGRAGALILETLETLARDALPRVRAILADELKQADHVPAHLIERLARDEMAEVAAPVLEFSPLLTEDFLVELIGSTRMGASLSAVARRAALGRRAADAIVARDDAAAIALLLRNASAQIREETLDALVERAESVPAWHEPLVRRPSLSQHAMRRLAEFVADSLIETLARRDDIDPDTARGLRAAMRGRLADTAESAADAGVFADDATLIERARRLQAERALDPDAVMRALAAGEHPFVMAALSVLACLPLAAVQKAISLKSTKGITSLAWKAGLEPRHVVQLQLRLAHIPPSAVLGPSATGGFPLSEADMRWQIDYFSQ